MLTSIQARSYQGALLTLPLDEVANGFVVADVEGLDPVKATIVSSSFARIDGTQYHSSRRESRNIKLRLELEPNYVTETVKSLRSRLYEYFMPKFPVDLTFSMSDGLSVDISGRVESFETPMFTKEPAVDISIVCFKPDFIDPNPVTYNGTTSISSGALTSSIDYAGNTETGITLVFNVPRPMSQFTFYHQAPDGTLSQLDYAGSLQAGDKLTIGTNQGNKYATLTRAGSDSSALNGISPYSKWIELQPGLNYVRFYSDTAGDPYTLTYTNRYGGL